MTFFIEFSGPIQWKPYIFRSESMTRLTWLFFAVGKLHVPFRKFCETRYDWSL